ncbi:transmembrane protein 115-like [Dreissena polymorpha]|uniref:Transmembrane protein 115 n=1 Tax=Dreissena polymorpha TaxID=45954 RepID=A0A9D4M2K7_DREPO|nr:transmembrane protein 115-like [Dreissena polymorpha]KAH3868047.1 hypothetical protein DPMN_031183 [Dreissena polymorpha]
MAASMIQRNIPVFKQNMSAAFGNSSLVVKTVAVLVFFGYFLSFIPKGTPYITVTPGYVLPPNFWVWTYLTHSFVEFHIWDVLADVLVVILCGKLLEPLWGAMDMLIFFVITNLLVAITTSFTYLFIYFATKNEDYLFETYIHGLAGYIAGFSVAVKQVMPDHVLVTSPFGKLRNTHIPLILVSVVITLRLLGALDGPYPIMFTWGVLISWIYLRFYQKHSNGNRGDMADNFSFASFFPSKFQPVVNILANTVFSFFVKVKICKKPQRRYDVSSPTTITITLPGTDPQDAERRKNLALKALNERLNKTAESSNTSWPSLDDEEVTSPVESSPKGDNSAITTKQEVSKTET